ncbi:MAG: polysaccharide biosynthesis C-terminal domain-containing protein [Clostridiales bacterium]|nr:polysaccharide biosynthesis C-terminal domain-containing protein [Clostridiales bacterium]
MAYEYASCRILQRNYCFVSQFWGIGNTKKIKHIAGISIIFVLVVAVIFTAVSLAIPQSIVQMFNSDSDVIEAGTRYLKIALFSFIPVALTNILSAVLRAVEVAKFPMYVSIFTTALNIFLDYSLIFGKFGFAKMGIQGAALATTVSACLGAVLIIAISLIKKNILTGKLSEFFSFNKNEFSSYVIKATSVVLNEGMWGLGTFVYNIIFGNMGCEYFSALTILRSFENVAFVIFISICSASSVMIGKSVGEGKIERGLLDAKRFIVIVPVTAVIISVFIVVFRSQLVGIFNTSNNISALAISTAEILMIIYAFAFPIRMLPYLEITSIFRAGGDTVTGAKYELACLWLFSVPATLIAIYVLGVPFLVAFAVMYIFEDIPKNIFTFFYYRSKKWIKPVTEEGITGYKKFTMESAVSKNE